MTGRLNDSNLRPNPGNAVEIDGVIYISMRFLLDNPEHDRPEDTDSAEDSDRQRDMSAAVSEAFSEHRSQLDINGRRYIAAAMLPLDPSNAEHLPEFIPQRALPSASLHRRRARVGSVEVNVAASVPETAPTRDVVVHRELSEAEFHDQFMLGHRPCVVRGGAREWPAVTRWRDDAYLRRIAGDSPIKRTTSIRSDLAFGHMSPMDVTRFDEFLDGYASDPRRYVNDSDVPEPLVPDLGTHAVHRAFEEFEDYCCRTGMFMGRGDQRAPLHYDDEDNLYTVLAGEKRFVLFDVADFRRMYPHNHRLGPDFSAADCGDFDRRKFPLMAGATRYVAHLYPGDILYVPSYWWHSVTSIGRNIAVSLTRTDRRSQLRAFIKLVHNHALPLSDGLRAEMLAMIDQPVQTARRVQRALEPDRLLRDDLFSLYLKLGLVYAHSPAYRAEVVAAHDALREAVAQRLNEAEWSYPVLYLMQNFYRCDTGIFMV